MERTGVRTRADTKGITTKLLSHQRQDLWCLSFPEEGAISNPDGQKSPQGCRTVC